MQKKEKKTYIQALSITDLRSFKLLVAKNKCKHKHKKYSAFHNPTGTVLVTRTIRKGRVSTMQ